MGLAFVESLKGSLSLNLVLILPLGLRNVPYIT